MKTKFTFTLTFGDLIAFVIGFLLPIVLCCSCSTKKQVVYADVFDTLIVTKTDTVKDIRYVTQKEKEYIDRWNDRIVTINLNGDTLKDVQKQTVYVEKDSYLRDSVSFWQSKYNALLKSKNHNQAKIIEKQPPWYEQFINRICHIATAALVLVLIIFGFGKLYFRKKC